MISNSIPSNSRLTNTTINSIFDGETKRVNNRFSQVCDDKKLSVLFYLMKMKTLTPKHIQILVYTNNSISAVYMALRSLYHDKLVDYHVYGKGRGIGNQDRLYFLTQNGFDYIQASRHDNSSAIFRRYQKPFVNSYYNHRVKLLDFWVVLLMETRKKSAQYSLKQLIPEWEKYNSTSIVLRYSGRDQIEYTIKPDATFILQNKETGKKALYFLEIDLASESVFSEVYPSITNKLERYQYAFKVGAFRDVDMAFSRFDGARVLFITTSKERIEHIFHTLDLDRALSDAFLFSTHDEIWRTGVISGTYSNTGFKKVKINSNPAVFQ